jgi:trehalose-6-phosphatase
MLVVKKVFQIQQSEVEFSVIRGKKTVSIKPHLINKFIVLLTNRKDYEKKGARAFFLGNSKTQSCKKCI